MNTILIVSFNYNFKLFYFNVLRWKNWFFLPTLKTKYYIPWIHNIRRIIFDEYKGSSDKVSIKFFKTNFIFYQNVWEFSVDLTIFKELNIGNWSSVSVSAFRMNIYLVRDNLCILIQYWERFKFLSIQNLKIKCILFLRSKTWKNYFHVNFIQNAYKHFSRLLGYCG